MPVSARKYKGKLKRDIATEAFEVLGPQATLQQVDEYFRTHYKLPYCERSMFCAAKRVANGCPPPVRRRYRRFKENDKEIVALVARTRQLAYDMGGFDALKELISVLE